MPVIDASVYVALINANEESYARSWAWFEQVRIGNEEIVAPAIILPEVGAAISRGIGDSDLAQRTVDQLTKSAAIKIVPISSTLAERAAAIAIDGRIRGCDAVYVALAAELNDQLITLDHQQLERAASLIAVSKP